jgi:hypothetical protein
VPQQRQSLATRPGPGTSLASPASAPQRHAVTPSTSPRPPGLLVNRLLTRLSAPVRTILYNKLITRRIMRLIPYRY